MKLALRLDYVSSGSSVTIADVPDNFNSLSEQEQLKVLEDLGWGEPPDSGYLSDPELVSFEPVSEEELPEWLKKR